MFISLKEVILAEILALLEIHCISAVVGILHAVNWPSSCRCSNLFVHGQATCRRRVALAPGAGLHFCNAKSAWPLVAFTIICIDQIIVGGDVITMTKAITAFHISCNSP
jgi:hypothetical protein